MKTILIIILIPIAIIVLLLLIALFVKKDFSIKKSITIHKTKSEVFNYFKLIKNQEKYSVWVTKDPNIQLKYSGIDGTVGFVSSWTSEDKNVGVGAQEIKEIVEGENMTVEIRFKKPFEATNYAKTSFSANSNNETIVTNEFYGTSKYPMNLMNLFMDKIIGKDIIANLENAKKEIEK